MQHQYQDNKILKHEDEMTDISKMPKETLDRIAAKPAYTQTDAPASQSTTMQSVSMGEVPKEGQEDILGSVASIHDQMQPGSFMSPISDRKSGSIENFSTEDKATSTEPSLLKDGVDAVKEAFYISKEERADIKDAVVTEAKALGEAASYFAHVAAEKIEGMYHAAAGKISEVAHDLGLTGNQASSQLKAGASEVEKGASELKSNIQKKAYLLRKSMRRYLKSGRRQFEVVEKKAGMGAGFAKVFIREEAKDLKRRARRFQKDWKKDAKDTKGALKKSLQEKGRKVDHKYTSLEKDAKKNIETTAESLKQSFQQKGREFDHKYTSLENQAKEYVYELTGKARQYKREFDDEYMVSDYLRGKARYLRSGARRVVNEVSRSAYLAKYQLEQKAGELKGQFENKSQDFSSDDKSNKFLLDFSSSEWNNNSFDTSRFSDNSESSKYLLEIPASEWNFSNAEASRLRAGFLNTRAQGWINRAAKEFSLAQKKFESGNYKKDAKRLYNKASKKAGDVQSIIKSSVDQMIDSASGKLAESSDKLNRQFNSGKGQEIKKEAKTFMQSAAEVGREVMGELSDAADKTMRFMMEKKANIQYQAELMSMDKFPSQEALAKKEAINSEIRSLHKDNKENLSQ